MFNRIFGRAKSPPDPRPEPQLGMLALRSTDGLNGPAITAAWEDLFPGAGPLTGTVGDKGAWEFKHSDRSLILAQAPFPIPRGDIESACERSWMWKEAEQEMAGQTSHLIVLTHAHAAPVEEAIAVSRLLAAAAKCGDPAGVYWGNCGQVHKPALFIDAMRSFTGGNLPVMLWVGVVVSADRENGPFTLSSRGLRCFGHKELEIIDAPVSVGRLRMLAYEVINYLLLSGPVLKHGHTFGQSRTERFRVEHTTSRFRENEPVLRLHM